MNGAPDIGSNLSTPERILLFCIASGSEWAHAGVTGATEIAMLVRGLIDRDAARVVLTPEGRAVLDALLVAKSAPFMARMARFVLEEPQSLHGSADVETPRTGSCASIPDPRIGRHRRVDVASGIRTLRAG
jgi:hypothetical protein